MPRPTRSITNPPASLPAVPDRRLGTVRETQDYARIGKNTVYRLIASGEIKAYKAGRILRVDLDSVDAWLRPVRAGDSL